MGKRTYAVIWRPRARERLRDIYLYCAEVLRSRIVAERLAESLVKAGNSLSYFPYRCRLILEEPWYSQGIHRLQVKNYYLYYTVDDATHTVSIASISHIKQEQMRVLENMDDENEPTAP